MNFLFKKTRWSNLELGILKICLISFGVIIGVALYDIVGHYLWIFRILFGTTVVCAVILWVKKMRSTYNSKSI